MAMGLIPWNRMREWCRVDGLDADATNILVEALCYADVEELQRRNAKNKPPTGREGRSR